MLLVKFSAEDLRILERAKTDPEKLGCFQMVTDRIEQAKTLKAAGKVGVYRVASYSWQAALKQAKEVLDDTLTLPPFPDYRWYQRINGVLRQHAFTDEYTKRLAEYAKEHLLKYRKTIGFDFMICQHERILAGEFNNKIGPNTTGAYVAPDLTTHKLPEE